VSVEVGSGPASAKVHQIQLSYGASLRVVAIDQETFMAEEFFGTLVLHQVHAAIEGLAAAGSDWRDSHESAALLREYLNHGPVGDDPRAAEPTPARLSGYVLARRHSVFWAG
jgi:hypothetical protein